jgi:hypothetical protein
MVAKMNFKWIMSSNCSYEAQIGVDTLDGWTSWLQVDVNGPSMVELMKVQVDVNSLDDCSYDVAVNMCALNGDQMTWSGSV